jgi:hypothetical protein
VQGCGKPVCAFAIHGHALGAFLQIVDQDKLATLLASYLEEYNMEHKAPLNLGAFSETRVFIATTVNVLPAIDAQMDNS